MAQTLYTNYLWKCDRYFYLFENFYPCKELSQIFFDSHTEQYILFNPWIMLKILEVYKLKKFLMNIKIVTIATYLMFPEVH